MTTLRDEHPRGNPSGPIDVQTLRMPEPARLPIATFARLVRGLIERDYRLATEARKELRKCGFSVMPMASYWGTGGRR